MRPIKGFDDVKASGDYERLAPGGYVIKITNVKDEKAKEYLQVVFDIAEGPEAGRYKNEEPGNEYRHAFIRSYKDSALGMLKAFTEAVDATNGTNLTPTVKTGLDEKQLIGKLLGVVFGYEEYKTNAGEIKQRLYLKSCKTADQIRKGDFKIPAFKPLAEEKPSAPPEGFTPLTDADVPF